MAHLRGLIFVLFYLIFQESACWIPSCHKVTHSYYDDIAITEEDCQPAASTNSYQRPNAQEDPWQTRLMPLLRLASWRPEYFGQLIDHDGDAKGKSGDDKGTRDRINTDYQKDFLSHLRSLNKQLDSVTPSPSSTEKQGDINKQQIFDELTRGLTKPSFEKTDANAEVQNSTKKSMGQRQTSIDETGAKAEVQNSAKNSIGQRQSSEEKADAKAEIQNSAKNSIGQRQSSEEKADAKAEVQNSTKYSIGQRQSSEEKADAKAEVQNSAKNSIGQRQSSEEKADAKAEIQNSTKYSIGQRQSSEEKADAKAEVQNSNSMGHSRSSSEKTDNKVDFHNPTKN